MRKTFVRILLELAEKDEDIYLLTGDLGFSVFEEFAKKFPSRFLNCGIAEQNMMGVAAGLALSGKKPYVYSIIPFVTMRCFEQIRNDVCYQNLNVKIIGVGAGFAYGPLGSTHHALEDISILRTLPNISIFYPADLFEMEKITIESYKKEGPAYIRIDKNNKKLYKNAPDIVIGKPVVFKNGKESIIITTGGYLEIGINLVDKLLKQGYDFELISMPTIKPINENSLIKELKNKKFIFTLEEHRLAGGLGSAVGEILLKNGLRNDIFKSFGVESDYLAMAGSQDFLRKQYKIDQEKIYQEIIKTIKNAKHTSIHNSYSNI